MFIFSRRTINEYDRVKAFYNTDNDEKVGIFDVATLNIFSNFTFCEIALLEGSDGPLIKHFND